MTTTLTVRDESTSSLVADMEFALEIPSERLTVRELIRARVHQEVCDYNLKKSEYYTGLVQPLEAEATLSGARMPRNKREIDPEAQTERAIEAFHRNGVLVLVDDRQVEDIDAEIEITPDTTLTFLKLIPLVGG